MHDKLLHLERNAEVRVDVHRELRVLHGVRLRELLGGEERVLQRQFVEHNPSLPDWMQAVHWSVVLRLHGVPERVPARRCAAALPCALSRELQDMLGVLIPWMLGGNAWVLPGDVHRINKAVLLTVVCGVHRVIVLLVYWVHHRIPPGHGVNVVRTHLHHALQSMLQRNLQRVHRRRGRLLPGRELADHPRLSS